MASFVETGMISVSLAIFAATFVLYSLADFAVTHEACGTPCRSCPHWDGCLSRRVCRIRPSQDPELCILLWN
jgi:hypothetical protein